MNLLEMPMIAAIRRNHALEHATIHLLTQRHPQLHLVGRTTASGFNIYGPVETEAVAAAAREGLARLQAGERHLALHPRCGTNLATAGLLAGLSSIVVMRGRFRLSKLPRLLLAAVAAVLVAQPLGLAIQEHVTTSLEVAGVRIEEIRRQQVGNLVVHRVKLRT